MNEQPARRTVTPIPADRWAEIDLYWFEKEDVHGCVERLWDRFAPLFAGVTGEKGIILNIGWLVDYITEWSGRPEDPIPFPAKMHTQHYTELFPNTGATETRMDNWRKRFEHVEFIPVEYEKWTYGDIGNLVAAIKGEAARRGFPGMRVGSLVLAWGEIYGGAPCQFIRKQPQVFHRTVNAWRCYNPEAKLKADPGSYAAFPGGIPEGITANEFFAKQWGRLSQAIGLDALVLRDSMINMGIYGRFGPYGHHASPDPEKVATMSRASADLVKQVKQANPDAWIMGYSNSACAVADWRIGCVDLEALAAEGHLDAFIEQTWAGAWNEAGQRKETFWNYPTRGWTAQLAFTLLHGAVLAKSKVRHYTLIEGYDAWEPGDVIHVSPERLRWGIRAYLHAAVKTPFGLKFPSGSYISWLNQGKRLLAEDDVDFIAGNANEAILDARETVEVAGPTLVYCRSAMEWQCAHAPDVWMKEWVDEQAAIVMKGSVPILSATRVEYLPEVKSDLFIFQSPVHLRPEEKQHVLSLLRLGEPAAIWGSPANGIDPEIAALAGLTSSDPAPGALKHLATLATSDPEFAAGIPASFKLFHHISRNTPEADAHILYAVEGSPALIMREADGLRTLVWDPCEYNENVGQYDNPVPPIPGITGSPYPFVLVARGLRRMLGSSGRFRAESDEVQFPVTVHAWTLRDGSRRILICDTEEGYDHTDSREREVTIHLPAGWPASFTERNTGALVQAGEGRLSIRFERFRDRLYGSSPVP